MELCNAQQLCVSHLCSLSKQNMKLNNPVTKVRGFATEHSVKLSETTMAKTEEAGTFLSGVGDAALFTLQLLRDTISRNFEFKEFIYQCFQIGYKSLPL